MPNIEDYVDKEGLVALDFHPGKWSTGNAILYTGITCQLIQYRPQYEDAVKRCEAAPGCYNRNPGRPDLNAWDDHIGAACVSPALARDVYNHGKTHLWSYNNQNPDKFSLQTWHGRRPDVISFYRLMAGKGNFIDILITLLFTFIASITGKVDTSGAILRWLMLFALKAKYAQITPAYNMWIKRIQKDYGTQQALFTQAFGPDHPLTHACK